MTTIYDSLTTPTPIYNLSGTTIDSIADGDDSSGSPVGGAITRTAQHTVVFVVQSFTHSCVVLPSGTEIGDTVEVYVDQSLNRTLAVFAPSGETFGNAVPANEAPVFAGGSGNPPGLLCRKVGSALWGAR